MRSIKRYLIFRLLCISITLLLTGFFSVYWLLRKELYDQLDQNLRSGAQLIADELKDADSGLADADFLDEIGELEKARAIPAYYEICSTQSAASFRSASLGKENLVTNKEPGENRHRSYSRHLHHGLHIRVLVLPVSEHFQIAVASDQHELDEALTGSLGVIISVALLTTLAIVIGLPLYLKRGLFPLEQLGSHFEKLEASSLDQPVSINSMPVELGTVVRRLNQMLERLDASFARERRVSSNLAHELRTPLAELKLMTETAIKWPQSRTESSDTDLLKIIQAMESTIERMLLLARSENGLIKSCPVHVNLEKLIRDHWTPHEIRAREKGVSLHHQHHGVAEVFTDPEILGTILSNLFDNAVCYTPKNAKIEAVSEAFPHGEFSLTLSNPTEELTPDDLPRLGERYWRKQDARSVDQRHIGLGLSIIRDLSQSLGYETRLEITPDKIFSVHLTPAQHLQTQL